MAYGIQINSSDGITQFDSDSRITRFIGTFSYASFTPPTVITIPITGIVDDGTWACFSDNLNVGVTITAGNITVSAAAGTQAAGNITVFRY